MTLDEIIAGMAHTGTRSATEILLYHIPEKCALCQLIAFRAEMEEMMKKWLESLSRCVGYPTCDGDLIATEHDLQCPESKRERKPMAVKQCAAELRAKIFCKQHARIEEGK